MSTAAPATPLPRDKNTAAWSLLQRHTAMSSPPTPASPSSHIASIAPLPSLLPSLTTTPSNDANGQPAEFPSCALSPSSPFPLQPEALPIDANDESHSPDFIWHVDSSSGDHVSCSFEMKTPTHMIGGVCGGFRGASKVEH